MLTPKERFNRGLEHVALPFDEVEAAGSYDAGWLAGRLPEKLPDQSCTYICVNTSCRELRAADDGGDTPGVTWPSSSS